MTIKILLFLSAFSSLQASEKLTSIFTELDDKEFSVRKAARVKLHQYVLSEKGLSGEELLQKMIDADSPEVRHALKHVAMLRLYSRGFLGVSHKAVGFTFQDKNHFGISISGVTQNTPAERAGLQVNDIIIALGDDDLSAFGAQLKGPDSDLQRDLQAEFSRVIKSKPQGKKVKITFVRNNKRFTTEATLASYNLTNYKKEFTESDQLDFEQRVKDLRQKQK